MEKEDAKLWFGIGWSGNLLVGDKVNSINEVFEMLWKEVDK